MKANKVSLKKRFCIQISNSRLVSYALLHIELFDTQYDCEPVQRAVPHTFLQQRKLFVYKNLIRFPILLFKFSKRLNDLNVYLKI